MLNSDIENKFGEIKLLAMDVDGTMTDGAMYFNEHGEAIKRFCAEDGMGIKLLHQSGIKTAIITSVDSKIAETRAKKLGMNFIKLDRFDKDKAIKEISEESGIPIENIAFAGDDVNDIGAMKLVPLACAPANATAPTKENADYICEKAGGYGAIREIAEAILSKQGKPLVLNI